jgi:hypothetical protein
MGNQPNDVQMKKRLAARNKPALAKPRDMGGYNFKKKSYFPYFS